MLFPAETERHGKRFILDGWRKDVAQAWERKGSLQNEGRIFAVYQYEW